MPSSSFRVFCLLFLITLAALVTVNWGFFFASPWLEQGDTAVNALQIERARQGRELLGNYSRFHFNHPGPAFFYVYAAGEIVLRDWLAVCPSPHNAHTLAGLALQTFFFSLALSLASSWVRRPLFLPLALLAAAVHFYLAGSALLSIWPPHALLMPFLAFWTACFSIAAGRGRDLPWAVLAGSFLVHGHVTQPLFVLGLFLPAYWLLWRRARTASAPAPWRAHPWAHAAAGLILAVFLVPIVADWTRGENSNLLDILRHLQFNGGDRKNPVSALLYLVSFLGYENQQDTYFTQLTWGSLAFLRNHWVLYAAWTGLVVLLVRGWKRGWFAPEATLAGHGRLAVRFWLWTAGLCVVWGIMQAGPMFPFNGYFYHALNYLILLAAAALVASAPRCASLPRWTGTALAGAALAVGLYGFRMPELDGSRDDLMAGEAVLELLAREPTPRQPILLSFNHRDWPQVLTAALVMKRLGIPFYADENWEFMLQAEHLVPVPWLSAAQPPMRVWRFIPHAPGAPGLRFGAGLNIMTEPARLAADRGEIDFSSQGNSDRYLGAGLASPEGAASWTSQPDVLLQFRPAPADRDVELHLFAAPFLPSKRIVIQPTELRFNGVLLFSAPFTEPGVLRVRIPKDMWNQHPIAALHLHFPNAKAPWQVGVSGDVRILALAVKRLTTQLADTPPP